MHAGPRLIELELRNVVRSSSEIFRYCENAVKYKDENCVVQKKFGY